MMQENKHILEDSEEPFDNESKVDLCQILKQIFMGPLLI